MPAAASSTGNYVVPLDAAPSGITRPLVEILRDLNKRVAETIVLPASRLASASASGRPHSGLPRAPTFFPHLRRRPPRLRRVRSDLGKHATETLG